MYWIGVGALLLMCLIYNIGFVFVLGYMPGGPSHEGSSESRRPSGRKKTKNLRRSVTLRFRHSKKVPWHRELQLSRSRNSNRQIVVPSEAKGWCYRLSPCPSRSTASATTPTCPPG